jgi:hypothetical protein
MITKSRLGTRNCNDDVCTEVSQHPEECSLAPWFSRESVSSHHRLFRSVYRSELLYYDSETRQNSGEICPQSVSFKLNCFLLERMRR